MKFTIYLLISFGILTFQSCRSPVEVPAERRKVLEQEPENGLKHIQLIPSALDFGIVRQRENQVKYFGITNTSLTQSVEISSIDLGNDGNSAFRLESVIAIPFVVAPLQTVANIAAVEVYALKSGALADSIVFNENAQFVFIATAQARHLSVWAENNFFDSVEIEKERSIAIQIHNDDDNDVAVNSFAIDDAESAFAMENPTMDTIIAAGQTLETVVVFTPSFRKFYQARMRFSVAGAKGDVINEVILTGIGK